MEPRERAAFVSFYAKVLTAAWSDDEYAARLQSDPRAALAEMGFELPAGATVRITREAGGEPDLQAQVVAWEEGAETGRYELWVLDSPLIETRELSEADLDSVAGGDAYSCCCSPCCTST
jgi:hypothetical protein